MKKAYVFIILLLIFVTADVYCDNALDFDGIDDYVNIPDNNVFDLSAVTIEMWFYWDESATNVNFLTAKSLEELEIHTGGGISNGIRFIPTANVYLDTPANAFAPGTWVHLACVYDPGQSIGQIYINGINTGAINHGSNPLTTAIIHSSNEFRLGKRGDSSYIFNGKMDDVRIWNYARTQSEIQAGMVHVLNGTESGLTAYWRFDSLENLGINNDGTDDVRDFTANNLHGDTNGSTLTLGAPIYRFTDIGAGLSNVSLGNATWGDYDNDGDLDILLTGSTTSGDITRIYRNDPSPGSDRTFTNINAGLPGNSEGSAVWGDYDNDGDLDILMTGYSSKIFRNDNGVFTDINAGLALLFFGNVAWGDYDNDGDLDILQTGSPDGNNGSSIIYRNEAGVFTNINAGLTGVYFSNQVWGDYDNDGDLDILISGETNYSRVSKIYRNDAGIFTEINAGLETITDGGIAWGDYDNDGDLDILISGRDYLNRAVAKIFQNNAGVFTNINAGLTGVSESNVAWGDFDNDGDLDVLLSGNTLDHTRITKIYRNDLSSGSERVFSDINADIPGISNCVVNWGDYDNDGDLDILSFGVISASSLITRILRNDITVANTAPTAPTNLQAVVSGTKITFSWNAATDEQTPSAGLTYNLRIGTTPGADDVFSSMSLSDGWRKIPKAGSLNSNTEWSLNLPGGNYYWSVQAIDNSFAGSAFAPEQNIHCQVYDDITSALVGVSWGSVAWGDYDNDGDLDVLITGETNSVNISRIYRNDAGVFVDINAGLPGVKYSSVEWCDYDNDGDLDILLAGTTNAYNNISCIYRNDPATGSGRTFTDINAGLQGVSSGCITWGDYDNDGDQDILIAGNDSYYCITRIYRNDPSTGSNRVFTDINAGLTGVEIGHAAWGDYDNDGDLDVLMCGLDYSGNAITKIYRNDQSTGFNRVFTDINAGLTGVYEGNVDWGDYDNDGDLDILISGETDYSGNNITYVYRNDNSVFVNINAGLPGIYYGSTAWADLDNDGSLEIIITGLTQFPTSITKIYHRNNDSFTEINTILPAVWSSNLALGDYDKDGVLDILLTGTTDNSGVNRISKIFHNNVSTANTKPTVPTGLVTVCTDSTVTFSWNSSTDNQTPTSALTYNLRVGTAQGLNNLLPSMAQTDGWRKIAKSGNQYHNNTWTMNLSTTAPSAYQICSYYWSVQAVDNGFVGSAFATEKSFGAVRYPTLLNEAELKPSGNLLWQTNNLSLISSYQIQIDNNPDFLSPEVDDNVLMPNSRSVNLYAGVILNELPDYAGLIDNTVYYWRMRPVYNNGWESIFTDGSAHFFFNKINTAPEAPENGFSPENGNMISGLTPIISWNNASDPDLSDNSDHLKYCVELDTSNTFQNPVYTLLTEFGQTFVHVMNPLISGYRYYYRVKTIDDESAESDWSAVQQFITLIPPQNITIARAATGVMISWDAVPINIRSIAYTVYSSTDLNAVFPDGWVVEAANLTTTSWNDPNTSASCKFYRVTVGDGTSLIRSVNRNKSRE